MAHAGVALQVRLQADVRITVAQLALGVEHEVLGRAQVGGQKPLNHLLAVDVVADRGLARDRGAQDIDGVLQPTSSQKRFEHDLEALRENLAERYGGEYRQVNEYDLGAVVHDWHAAAVARLRALCAQETRAHPCSAGGPGRFGPP